MLTAPFKYEFENALEAAKKLPPKEGFDACVEITAKHHLSYEFDGPCEHFLVHEENRSRLMLTAGKCHEAGEKIHFAGADLQELRAAFAFELSKLPDRRNMQLAKNNSLIQRANGLLSNLTGKERFVTVGSSHISQFCKHAQSGGKTCRLKLQDPDTGLLDVAKLKRNRNFKTMIEKGWKWTIFPSELDEAYPSFAKLAQRALNSSNNCRQELGEIELACQLVEFHAVAAADGHDDPKQACIDAVQENVSMCHGYSKTLLEYAMEYGGGDDLPWLRFVDELNKHLNASKMLGSAFWNTILSMKFWSDKKVHQKAGPPNPMVRLSIICLQSCMPDSRDGIATFITDSDLRKAVSKSSAPLVEQLETMLEEAFSFTSILAADMFDIFMQPVGDLLMKSAMMLIDKEKKAFDKRKRTVNELKSLYLEDLSKVIGKKVDWEPWSTTDVCPAATGPSTKAPTATKNASAFKSLSDFANAESQAQHLGYNIGDFIFEKKFENIAENWWTIMELQSKEDVVLQKAFNYNGSELQRIKVSLEILVANWKVKEEPRIPQQIAECQLRPNSLDIDRLKCTAFQELLKADKAASKDVRNQGIAIWTNPSMVRSTREIPEGELILFPTVPLAHIASRNNKEGSLQQIHEDPPLFLLPIPSPKVTEGKVLTDDQLAVAYWLISTSSDADNANMQELIVEKGGFTFKALTNFKAIQPFAPLQVFKEAGAKKADMQLTGATLVTEDGKRRRITRSSAA